MATLHIWLLLFACVGASSGDGQCPASYVTELGAPGGPVLLRFEQSERAQCEGECGLQVTKDGSQLLYKGRIPAIKTECKVLSPGCHVHPNGSLELTGAPDASENYTLRLEYIGTCKYEKHFRVHIQDRVSVPDVTYTCGRNSSVQLSCVSANGSNPSYTWHMDGTPKWNLTKEIRTEYESGLRNVTCTVKNNVSKERSKPIDVTCPEPVSEPEVQLSCFAPGGIGLCCRVENGTEVSYSWTVNGMYYNSSASCRNVTIPQTELVNATCTAWNLVSNRTSRPVIVTCPETPTPTPTLLSTNMPSTWSPTINSTGNSTSKSKGCAKISKCVLWSAIGAASIIVVTVGPLVIGVLYTMPRKDEV